MLEDTLKQILGEFKILNNRMSGLETNVQSGFNAVEQRIDKVEQRIDKVEKKIDAVEDKIDAKFDALEEKIDAVEEKFDAVEEKFDAVEEKIDAVEEKLSRKLDTIYAQVAHNTEQEVTLGEIISKVEEHDTDIKILKKLVSNY